MSNAEKHARINLRSLGREEAKAALGLAASRASASTLASVAQMLDGDGQKAREVVRRLLAKGWLQRVASGRYVFLPPEWGAEKVEDYDVYVLASASVDEGYVGWWAAASRHGFTTQVPSTVHVATNRQVPPREIQGTPIRYVSFRRRSSSAGRRRRPRHAASASRRRQRP